MDKEVYYVSQEGYDLFVKGIDDLRNKLNCKGKEKSESFNSAVGDGWHDNFDFEQSARDEKKILKQIDDNKKILNNLVVVKEETNDEDIVKINDIVLLKLEYEDNSSEELLFKLVGTFYTNNTNKEYQEITLNSPIGKAIYHKKFFSMTEYIVNDKKIKVYIERYK